MANELEQTTINATGTSWVDSSPGPISTGYQAQNTNITARTVGQDLSSVSADGGDVVIAISGPIDVDGLPFSVTSEITLSPDASGTYYIKVVDGSTTTQKSLELTTDAPVWDAAKNALYDDDDSRVLNWICLYDGTDTTVYRTIPSSNNKIYSNGFASNAVIYSGTKEESSTISCGTGSTSTVTAFPATGVITGIKLYVSGYYAGSSETISLEVQKYVFGEWVTISSVSDTDAYIIGPKTKYSVNSFIVDNVDDFRLLWTCSSSSISSRIAQFTYERLI